MAAREAACSCGQLRVTTDGEPMCIDSAPERIAVPVGAFADPAFPPPRVSVWESRRHDSVAPPAGIEHERVANSDDESGVAGRSRPA